MQAAARRPLLRGRRPWSTACPRVALIALVLVLSVVLLVAVSVRGGRGVVADAASRLLGPNASGQSAQPALQPLPGGPVKPRLNGAQTSQRAPAAGSNELPAARVPAAPARSEVQGGGALSTDAINRLVSATTPLTNVTKRGMLPTERWCAVHPLALCAWLPKHMVSHSATHGSHRRPCATSAQRLVAAQIVNCCVHCVFVLRKGCAPCPDCLGRLA